VMFDIMCFTAARQCGTAINRDANVQSSSSTYKAASASAGAWGSRDLAIYGVAARGTAQVCRSANSGAFGWQYLAGRDLWAHDNHASFLLRC
jgi:hypothetical protein